MTNHYTLEEVQEEAAKVVAAFEPGTRNPGVDEMGCMYTTADGEHCIAAQICVNLGVEIPAYGMDDNEQPVDMVDGFTASFTFDALGWLTAVQRKADNGVTWGDAVELVNNGVMA